MLVAFPAPVLSVTVDAVRELEGRDALSGLWTLFTKCKESLKDGRRLENISWRLWYRELMMAGPSLQDDEKRALHHQDLILPDHPYRPPTPDERSPSLSETTNDAAYFASTHFSAPLPASFGLQAARSPRSAPPARRSSSSARAHGSSFMNGSISVGKIICDMLPNPNNEPLPSSTTLTNPCPTLTRPPIATLSLSPTEAEANPRRNPVPVTSEMRPIRYFSILPLLPLPEPTTTTEAVISASSSLPTPATEEGDGKRNDSSYVSSSSTETPSTTTQVSMSETSPGSSVAVCTVYTGPPSPSLSDSYALAHPGEVQNQNAFVLQNALTTSQPPQTLTSTSAISISVPTPHTPPPPTLVVVNPTPNPTPHPTPPATPMLLGERRAHGQYLTLPGRSPLPPPAVPPHTPQEPRTLQEPADVDASDPNADSALDADSAPDADVDSAGADVDPSAPPDTDIDPSAPPDADIDPRSRSAVDTEFNLKHHPECNSKHHPECNAKHHPVERSSHHKFNSISSTTSSSSVFTGTTGATSDAATGATSDADADADDSGSWVDASMIGTVGKDASTFIVGKDASTFTAGKDASAVPAGKAQSSSPASSGDGRKNKQTRKNSVPASSPGGTIASSPGATVASSTIVSSPGATIASSPRATIASSPTTSTGARTRATQAPGMIRRASSGTSTRSRSRPTAAKVSSTKSQSQSRSRSRDAGGGPIPPGLLALGMTTVAAAGPRRGGGLGSRVTASGRPKIAPRGKGVIVARGLVRKESRGEMDVHEEEMAEREHHQRLREIAEREESEREMERLRKEREREGKRSALFNIGSNSDEGSAIGSKSAGSGSDVSGQTGVVVLLNEPVWKGKEREVDVVENELLRVQREKKEKEEAEAAAAAAVAKLALAAPLLPQQQRRTIVLATSESEYETDSEDDEDGSWSSEEMSGDDVEPAQQQPEEKCPPPPPPPVTAPVIPPPPYRTAAPIQRTVSNHNARSKQQLTRAQIQRQQAQANTQAIMEKAAAEAQRQRDMFAKLPVSSFQNLTKGPSRTRSAGLLTQLLNPPPELFPPNHPYRRGYSSGEIQRGQQQQRQGGGGEPAAPVPRAPGGLQMSKSTAALPLSSQVQVGSVYGTGVAMPIVGVALNGNGNGSGYRPKGRPQGQELEEDSGSEDDGNGGIQVSKSVAQERLKALAQRRGIATHGKQKSLSGVAEASPNPTADFDDVPVWARPQGEYSAVYGQLPGQPQRRQSSDNPTPIPVGHPYNLPPPAAPSTPRTTRRQMLQTEMSESLRRNLLWERQVSKVNLVGFRATTNGGNRNNVLGGLKPLTTTPSMVQLRAKGNANPGPSANGNPNPNLERTKSSDRERRGSGGVSEEKDERRRLAMARNKSWADDYHYKGW